MTLEEFSERFSPLSPHEKVKFLYTHIDSLSKRERIFFLLNLLQAEGTSPLVKATGLKFLREASYQEFELYKKYTDNNFRALSNAAKRAVKEFEDKEKRSRYYMDSVLRKLASLDDKGKRLKILKAIAKLNSPWVFRVLLESLADPCETIRDYLIKELSQREVWSLNPFYERLKKSPWYVRSAVVKILGRRKDSACLPHIEPLLADSNVDVRKCAADALGEIGGKEVLALLVKLTKDKSIYVRSAAAEAVRKVSRVRFSG
ncbi:MAG: HEAT repeat domain-containing protein [Clostridiales bacterium]|nr:HEAT repeat domain-containing protein [Clostridiales bacterium]